MELSRFVYVYWPRYFFSFYPPCVPWTLFTHWILHCFLTDHELFVNQRQWAPFLSCIVQICLPILLLTFDYVSGLFALRKCYSVLQSGLSIHLWFLDILVALELSLSLSAGCRSELLLWVAGQLGDWLHPSVALHRPHAEMLPPRKLREKAAASPFTAGFRRQPTLLLPKQQLLLRSYTSYMFLNPPTQFTSPCLQPRCHLN